MHVIDAQSGGEDPNRVHLDIKKRRFWDSYDDYWKFFAHIIVQDTYEVMKSCSQFRQCWEYIGLWSSQQITEDLMDEKTSI